MIMKIWRWAVALLLAFYAVVSLGIPLQALIYKLNGVAAEGTTPEMLALIQSMHGLQIASWLLALVLYLGAALFLLRKKAVALSLAVFGAILDIGQWISLKYFGDAYDAAFSSGQQAFDWSLFGFLAFIIGSITALKMRKELH